MALATTPNTSRPACTQWMDVTAPPLPQTHPHQPALSGWMLLPLHYPKHIHTSPHSVDGCYCPSTTPNTSRPARTQWMDVTAPPLPQTHPHQPALSGWMLLPLHYPKHIQTSLQLQCSTNPPNIPSLLPASDSQGLHCLIRHGDMSADKRLQPKIGSLKSINM